MTKILPVGTRIKFLKDLTEDACGDHPMFIYAEKGELGEVTGHGTKEGYWVKRDIWDTPFGAEYGTEFIEEKDK